jgi:hypothetical protein
METWKAIEGYEGFYEVSDQGRVRSLDRTIVNGRGISRRYRGCILKAMPNTNGYPTVFLSKGSHKDTRRIHQLVAVAFVGPIPQGHEVCHRDDVKTHNVPTNLVYQTHSKNMEDRCENGGTARGVRNGLAKLTDDDVRTIRSLRGVKSQREIGKMFGVSHTVVWQAQTGKCWSHVDAAS